MFVSKKILSPSPPRENQMVAVTIYGNAFWYIEIYIRAFLWYQTEHIKNVEIENLILQSFFSSTCNHAVNIAITLDPGNLLFVKMPWQFFFTDHSTSYVNVALTLWFQLKLQRRIQWESVIKNGSPWAYQHSTVSLTSRLSLKSGLLPLLMPILNAHLYRKLLFLIAHRLRVVNNNWLTTSHHHWPRPTIYIPVSSQSPCWWVSL